MKWNKGTPPSIGWWPTKNLMSAHHAAYRWWDGECWSWPAFSFESAVKASHWASKKEDKKKSIEWAERPKDWPERSRT